MKDIQSIKWNAITSYIALGYTTVVGLIVLPMYLKYLGAEAYGLVGFFTLMQAWMNLFDVGISPTLGRYIAIARGNENGFEKFIKLLRSFEIIFFVLASISIVVLFLLSDWFSQSWIKAEQLNVDTISYCISIMGIIVGLRFFSSLYRSGIDGMEDQVWLNGVNIAIVSLKFIGALILLHYITNDIKVFFEYQLFIGLIEVLLLSSRLYKILPNLCSNYGIHFSFSSVKETAPFAMSIAYTAGIQVVILQLDKLILSGRLSLSEFGYYALITVAANGIILFFSPLARAILPRMTLLISKGNIDEMLSIYRGATQVIMVLVVSISIVMGVYGGELLFAWTGNQNVVAWGKDVFLWLVMANAILAINSLQYSLQYAFGDLSLHVRGVTISAILQIPIIYYAATQYGAIGVAISWFVFRLIWFFIWTPLVHNKFVPKLHLKWLLGDIAPIMFLGIIGAFILNLFFNIVSDSRIHIFFNLSIIFLFMLIITSLGSRKLIEIIKSRVLFLEK